MSNLNSDQSTSEKKNDSELIKSIIEGFSEKFTHFDIELTQDLSPTLRIKKQNSDQEIAPIRLESMHHSAGALTETLYIYTEPFQKLLKSSNTHELNIGVVGLGLGYIEMTFILALLSSDTKTQLNLLSYELDTELQNYLFHWIQSFTQNSEERKHSIYSYMLKQMSAYFDRENFNSTTTVATEFKKIDFINSNEFNTEKIRWIFQGPLSLEMKYEKQFHFVAYDAFSQKTDNPLWTEEFLDYFIKNFCAESCVWATYACTGVLRRALVANGFTFIKKPGLLGKRDSTLAYRGVWL